ncbi:efflux transporter periplasmic adaptor subunit [Niabella ginsenosidivorans]|uniref:Efflux transporter periplasmic adaptor subunit n=1 Tax=Niabella ginsenosidivorans TaxID=1176587 RepID=A0A1A9I829_9BACT|nr:efflux RND transporter periplasmic adaptor subunit [Niabella ginsenosidivorans]ANH83776.1 efflux transporter periplasmic adaptor subunit [Niabella ginsenosidivorans]
MKTNNHTIHTLIFVPALIALSLSLQNCVSRSANPAPQNQAPALPVMGAPESPVTVYQEFSSSLEGKENVEIRPQVDGYLEKIYVDEGAYVTAGQPLFKINAQLYNEALNNAKASLLAAQASMQKAQVDVDRLKPLVDNSVVSDVQLKTAKANYNAAAAALAQAKAMVRNAEINVSYTLIKAPVNGYIGSIPFKTGSLVGRGEAQPLTMLSDVNTMYAYFSMSEPDFIAFKNKYPGETIEQKLKNVPAVELLLADNTVYPQKGKIELVQGQFDKTIGAINFRAAFPNPNKILRSGNTGKIRLPQLFNKVLVVPQEATFEIQDKVFVFTVDAGNKVSSKPIGVSGKNAYFYFVNKGLSAGEKIVLSGTGNLKDGAQIQPQLVSADSVLKANPI